MSSDSNHEAGVTGGACLWPGRLSSHLAASGLRPGPSLESYIFPLDRNDLYLIFTISPACGEHGLNGEQESFGSLSKYLTPPGVTPTFDLGTTTAVSSATDGGGRTARLCARTQVSESDQWRASGNEIRHAGNERRNGSQQPAHPSCHSARNNLTSTNGRDLQRRSTRSERAQQEASRMRCLGSEHDEVSSLDEIL